MQQQNIPARVIKVIVDRLGLDADEVKPEYLIKDDLGADSLDLIEVIMDFEKEFSITIPDEDCENDLTVLQAINLVQERAGGKA